MKPGLFVLEQKTEAGDYGKEIKMNLNNRFELLKII
jgi:hypothetical protein